MLMHHLTQPNGPVTRNPSTMSPTLAYVTGDIGSGPTYTDSTLTLNSRITLILLLMKKVLIFTLMSYLNLSSLMTLNLG